MIWARWYRVRDWVRTSMWLVPALFAIVALVLGWVMPRWDRDSPIDLGLNSNSIATALNAIVTGMLTFTGLVFSIVMLIVQFGSSTFSTRLMRWFWRSLVVKTALGTFIATFLYSLVALADVDSGTSSAVATRTFLLALVMVLVSVSMFLALLDRMAGLLRVARVTRVLGRQTIAVVDEVYPHPYDSSRAEDSLRRAVPTTEPDRVIRHTGEPASIMAIDKHGLVRYAESRDLVLELVPAVGQHVSRGATLFRVYGTAEVDDHLVRSGVIFGEERTIDGDPSFGFRLLADIALKALSPAVNDPTTAVQVLDRLEDLLRHAAHRRLAHGAEADRNGVARLGFPTPCWDDLLELGLDEILVYGAGAPQVTRRMAALLDNLEEDVPVERRPIVTAYRARLHRAIDNAVSDPMSRRFAEVADAQGIGPAAHLFATMNPDEDVQ